MVICNNMLDHYRPSWRPESIILKWCCVHSRSSKNTGFLMCFLTCRCTKVVKLPWKHHLLAPYSRYPGFTDLATVQTANGIHMDKPSKSRISPCPSVKWMWQRGLVRGEYGARSWKGRNRLKDPIVRSSLGFPLFRRKATDSELAGRNSP